MRRSFSALITLVILSLVIVGCEQGEQLQTDVQKALAKHAEMNNYRFSGSAELKVDLFDSTADHHMNPLTASLLILITNSKLTWEGVASVEPVKVELKLQLTPHSLQQTLDIPLLIQDNKMYLHIPAINENDEYYEIDLAALSEQADLAPSASPNIDVWNAAQLFSSSLSDLITTIEPKRFEDTTSKDAELQTISVTLMQKQVKEVIDSLFTALPTIVDPYSKAGLIQPETAEAWMQKWNEEQHNSWLERTDEITLNDPISLMFKLDEAGFARESQLKFNMTMASDSQGARTWSINMVNRYDEINQNPPFTMEAPTNTKSFADVMNFMSAK